MHVRRQHARRREAAQTEPGVHRSDAFVDEPRLGVAVAVSRIPWMRHERRFFERSNVMHSTFDWSSVCGLSRERTSTIERRGPKERMYSLAAFAAFAFQGSVSLIVSRTRSCDAHARGLRTKSKSMV